MNKIKILLAFIFLMPILVNAQWTTDTNSNTLVVDASGVNADLKAISTSDGKTYIVFWEVVAPPENYELRLQVLDVDGNQTLGSNGVLVSNTIPMSTFTAMWTISIDSNDNIYIGVTGTGGGDPAFAFKLDVNGNHLWGTNGLSVGSGNVVTILPLSSGEAVVSWLSSSLFKAEMQKYDASGNAVWASTQLIENGSNATVPANFFELSGGNFIAIFHSVLSGISTNLYAQRFNVDGIAQWVSPTQISNQSTVFNKFYYGTQDGDVVYFGYSTSHDNRFDSYVTRINSDGTIPWGINGMDFDTNQTDFEMDTRIAFSTGSQYIWAICNYTNTSQNQAGEYVQKFDKVTGVRQFTDNAKVVYPISTDDNVHVDALQLFGDQPLFLLKSGPDNGATPTTLSAVLLDENGDFAWVEESRPIATFSGNKGRIQFTKPVSNQNVTVFIEDKGTGARIYAQNFIDDALSINDLENETSLFFNNPIFDYLNVKSTNSIRSISVYNTIGQVIFSEKYDYINDIVINVQKWESGVYIIKFSTDKGIVSKKIIRK